MLEHYIRSYVEELKWTVEEFDRKALAGVIGLLTEARDAGRQILLVGNGGSAAAASHMACDLGKGTVNYADPGFRRFRVISLSDNNALITAIGNDLTFEDVFVEQLRMVMQPGDVVVLISASGNSPNLVRAAEYARAHGASTIGLLGFGGGRLAGLVDHALVVSSRNYGIAEDFHLSVQHIYTQYLRRLLAGPPRRVAFLDRDGVINERPAPHQYVERWEQFRFLDGAVSFLKGLTERGFAPVVVTNQQGVGRGVMSAEALGAVHASMASALAADGVALAGVFACPHLADRNCFCRKPRPGLIYRAINELPFLVDLERSILVGDTESDTEAGLAAGVPVRIAVADNLPASATHVASRLEDVLSLVDAAVLPQPAPHSA